MEEWLKEKIEKRGNNGRRGGRRKEIGSEAVLEMEKR